MTKAAAANWQSRAALGSWGLDVAFRGEGDGREPAGQRSAGPQGPNVAVHGEGGGWEPAEECSSAQDREAQMRLSATRAAASSWRGSIALERRGPNAGSPRRRAVSSRTPLA
ncbi:hypothetical protein ACP70R_010349 [Stipagrostis hirtigluma subsp. patula]